MQCWDPRQNDCYAAVEQRAFEGTTCANQSWCVMGHCVWDSAAPLVHGSCTNLATSYIFPISFLLGESGKCKVLFLNSHIIRLFKNSTLHFPFLQKKRNREIIFSGKYHVKFRHFVIFFHIFGQKCLPPKLTEPLRL